MSEGVVGGLKGRLGALGARLDVRESLTGWQQWMVFLLVALLLFTRMPSAFTRAQFYAEDGRVWFQEAYNGGWLRSLGIPEGGYLNTLQRVGAGVALLVPFRLAPLTMAVFGLVMQILPVTVLLSRRCRNWGPLSLRVLLGLMYVVSPNNRELHIVLTNSHWHLALVVMLLGFGMAPRGWGGRMADVVAFLLLGVSGPFCFLMLPFLLAYWWLRRQGWTLVQAGLLAVCSVVQIYFLTHNEHPRLSGDLGASFAGLVRLFGGDVIGAAIFGGRLLYQFAPLALCGVAAVGGLALFGYVLRFARLEMKLFTLYALVLFAAALRSPLISGDRPLWQLLALAYSGRYWFMPMTAFLWGLLWVVRNGRHGMTQRVARWTLCCIVIGVALDWWHKPYKDCDFRESARRFEEAQPGLR